MLDNETKRRIDSARDILVGKVPDPKSQVEQITIALIYKFMDDMDKEAIEFGGKASFFMGEYEKYGWSKIFDPRLGGYEMLSLYGEAIEKLDQNPNIPQLFRDIFKNAYLPYRDPETLKLFLKTINEFHYDHSEKLGDAFEYLLSVLGSQGDAGQFRTPRHIIDFIVNVLQPKKNETILDPACGTAGFLISSYKYMLKENTGKSKGDLLTPNDRKKLMDHFTGYDISPDMVRLSLVNMYLHHFTSPRIYEYDTLTSEDRWGDYFDIIMANPPFMTPKGGIKPHKKFTMQANRSEVLFVDYIAEHINPTTGRAGIIVPEGIIFQSATAYKALRKLLVDKNYLYAVVSLPAGIFNPYSGVKTSVLLMDKTIAKKTSKILFVKIENDGFDLGAQRKAIVKNDLTDALEVINNYQLKIKNNEAVEEFSGNYLLVEKEKIKTNADYNLSIDRYKVNANLRQSNYDLTPIGDICDLINGRAFKPEDWQTKDSGGLPIIRIQNLNTPNSEFNYYSGEVIERYLVNKNDLLFSWSGSRGTSFGAHIWYGEKAILNQHIFRVVHSDKVNRKYLLHALNKAVEEVEENLHGGVGLVHITKGNLERIKIPLPPLSIQLEIVNKIEGWQKIIDGAKQIIENYKPQIDIDPDWEMVTFENAPLEIVDGDRGVNYPNGNDFSSEGYCLFLNTKNVRENGFRFDELMFITKEKDELLRKGKLKKGDVLLTTRGTVGNTAYYTESVPFEHIRINSGMLIFRPDNKKLSSKYLYYFFQSENCQIQFKRIISGAAQPQLPIRSLYTAIISIPTIETQNRIVSQIEKELALVNSNKQLIQIFEQKIKDEINKLWQKDTKEYAIEDEQLSLVAEG